MVESSIVVTASLARGNLSRITLILWKSGFRVLKSNVQKSADGRYDEMHFQLEGATVFDANAMVAVKKKVPTVVNVDFVGSNQASGANATAQKSQQATRGSKQRLQHARRSSAPKLTNARINIVRDASKKLIQAYPDIHGLLVGLQTAYGVVPNSGQMLEIGNLVGAFVAQSHLKGKPIAKSGSTAQNSLLAGQRLFGNSSVTADSPATNNDSADNKFELIAGELQKFLLAYSDNNVLILENCPHIVSARAMTADCDFVMGFVKRFATDICHGQPPRIQVIATRSQGASACRLAIELAA